MANGRWLKRQLFEVLFLGRLTRLGLRLRFRVIEDLVEGPGKVGELVAADALAVNSHGAGVDAEGGEEAGQLMG